MVQRKAVSIVFLLPYLAVIIVVPYYALQCWQLEIGDWIDLIALLVFGGVFVLSGLGEILKVLRDPHFEIKNPRVKAENVNSRHEIKNLVFEIKNNGKVEAEGCRVKVVVKGICDNPREIVNPNLPITIDRGVFNVMPNCPVSITLGQVIKEQPTTCKIYAEDPDGKLGRFITLTKGTYKLEVTLVGRNFSHNLMVSY